MLLGWMVLAGACVVIPYTPPSETRHELADVEHPDEIRLSVGPRRFLEEMADELRDEVPRLTILDGQSFIDTAAPAGELSLAGLLQPDTRERIEALGADYLVLLGEPEDEMLANWGEVVPYIGFYGAQKTTGVTRYWAAIIDLRTMQLVDQVTTSATGTDASVGLFYGIFIVSNTDGSAQKGVIRNLAKTLAAARPDGSIRIAMLARERLVSEQERQAEARAEALQARRAAFPPLLDRAAGYPAFSESAPPQADEGLVYLYRPHETTGGFYPMVIMTRSGASEYELVRLWGGGYFPFRGPVGSLKLWIAERPQEAVTLEVEPGRTYFLRVDTRMGWNAPVGRLEVVEPNEGKAEAILCRQIPSARAVLETVLARAEEGYTFDQLQLAEFYAAGVAYSADGSLPRDPVEAYKWFTVVATTEGVHEWMHDSAAQARDALTSDLSGEEIAEATRRAIEWQAEFAARWAAAAGDSTAAAVGPRAPP